MSEEKSTTSTFWKLINKKSIIIPKLQRDYAQGREKNRAIEQIRTSLIAEIFRAVTEDNPLVLNFIFGTQNNGEFNPIDGQQRLTTLFLFHWYIFARTGDVSGLKQLENFSYETRNTSMRFCKNICKINDYIKDLDFFEETISNQIKNFPWFTGNFKIDPTIKSMLVVLDEFHNKFKDVADVDSIRDKLLRDDCPVSFLWLEIPNSLQTSDLYIKMNARGKLLSDFEIFKAKLQKSGILTRLLEQIGSGTTEQDKVRFISKYNNEYAEFFYKFFGKDYDNAMMSFIKEMLRDSYLKEVVANQVAEKKYRPEYENINSMTGSVLFRYIEKGGAERSEFMEYKEQLKDAFVEGLKRADDLLEKFSPLEEPFTFKIDTTSKQVNFSEINLFRNNYYTEERTSKYRDDLIRYSLYSFLYRFGIPTIHGEEVAYSMWRRIIDNVTFNSDFKNIEDVCKTFYFVESVIEKIKSYDEISILQAVSNIDISKVPQSISYQMKEEITKAKLIIQDASWKVEILDAENYFRDGEIGFILYCSETNPGHDKALFQKYLKYLKMLFDKEKELKKEVDKSKFEKAMLCMKDTTDDFTGHLLGQNKSTTSWGFLCCNTRNHYKELMKNVTDKKKKHILKELIDKLISTDIHTPSDIDEKLTDIIDNVDALQFNDESKWKLAFIENNLFDANLNSDKNKFKNCINIGTKHEILMLKDTTERSWSSELYTFLLYQKLLDLKLSRIDIKLHLDKTGELKDENGYPKRYIEIDNGSTKIGYDYDNPEQPYWFFNKAGDINYFSEEGVIQELQKYNIM